VAMHAKIASISSYFLLQAIPNVGDEVMKVSLVMTV